MMRWTLLLALTTFLTVVAVQAQDTPPPPPPTEAVEVIPPAPETPPVEAPAVEVVPPTPEVPPAEAPAVEAAPPPVLQDIKQVQFHVLIAETGEIGSQDVGVNLNYTRFTRNRERNGSVERVRSQMFDENDPARAVVLPRPDENPAPDNLRPEGAGQIGAGLEASILDAGRGTIDVIARALEQSTDVDLVSRPELLVRNEQEAEIHAGGEVPYQDALLKNGKPTLTVQWRPVGVTMRIKPKILSDNLIHLNIGKLEVSEILRIENARGLDLPVFSTRRQSGLVVVPNGSSLAIGGLTSTNVRRNERRIPLIGKLPILGVPFRSTEQDVERTNLTIFVTPTIVNLREMNPTVQRAVEFWRRQEWQNTSRIDDAVWSMEAGL